MDTIVFKTQILNKFDSTEFDSLYNDSKIALIKNLDWSKLPIGSFENCDDPRKAQLMSYYKEFFGLKARLQGRLMFRVYDESDPDRTLFYSSAYKELDINALRFDVTLFGTGPDGTKAWVIDFYKYQAPVFKSLIESFGLKRWYYVVNNDSDFVRKNLLNPTTVVRKTIPGRQFPESSRIITSSYGWDD
jgi:hypothetical protein